MAARKLNKAEHQVGCYSKSRKQKAQLLIAIVLVLSIAGTAAVLAQRKRTGNNESRRPAPESQIVTPAGSLSPSGPPVREYIYSGSRLISIEEPGSAQANNNDAVFVSQSVPTAMTAGQSYAVSITMRNTGNTTWTTADNYRLGSQNPQDNLTWGLSRVNLPTSTVAPNTDTTFTFNVTAPATPGQYNFQWRMLKEGVGAFGALTTNVVVSVASVGCTVAVASPPSSFPAETVWFDDQLPAGAQPTPASWPWDSTQKASGIRSHGEQPAAGFHQHFIANASPGVVLGPSDKIACYVLINSCSPPREIMLQYQDAAGGVTQWDHRAYWGEDLIFPTVQAGAGKFLVGALPQAGVWTRLEVLASSVGMAGKTMSGIAFGVYDGQAWFDHVSITGGCSVPIAGAPVLSSGDSIWVDDSIPAGAIPDGIWQWDVTQKASGAQSNTEPPASGLHQHYFYNAPGWTVSAGDKLICYLLINPCSPPKEVMLQWLDETNTWEHRAYWGQDLIPWGVAGTVSRFPMGPLPQSGVWVRLEVPASQVGLEGRTVKGMAYTLYDGQAWFDLAGKKTGTSTVPLITSLSPNTGTQETTFSFTISGSNLSGATAVSFSPATGITVSGISSTASQVTASVAINGSATTGTRNVSVTTGAGTSGTLPFTVQATNPAPLISSLNPNSVIAGSGSFTLTVNGPTSPLTYVSNSVVRVNGANRPTTFISGSQLQIAIAASEIASPGSLSISVLNPAPGGGTSSTEILSITSPATGCLVSLLSGDGLYGYVEGPTATAEWRAPAGAAVAKDPVSQLNALFVADTENNRIRMIYLEGPNAANSVLIAGNGVAGYGNGNGNALNARFNGPQEVAALTNASGIITSLLVLDTSNQMIRKLTPPAGGSGSWSVTEVAGQLGIAGADDGDFTTATFNFPRSLTTGTDGFIYVADSDNNAIRRVSLQGVVSTLLFGVNLGISFPAGITSSKTTGLLYFSDQGGNSIWRIDTNGGNALRIAGSATAGSTDGTGTSARFNKPYHLAWANGGATGESLYIIDRNNNKLRKLGIATASVTTQAGSGVAGATNGACSSAQFNSPRGVAVGLAGEVYVIDTVNNRIRRVQ